MPKVFCFFVTKDIELGTRWRSRWNDATAVSDTHFGEGLLYTFFHSTPKNAEEVHELFLEFEFVPVCAAMYFIFHTKGGADRELS